MLDLADNSESKGARCADLVYRYCLQMDIQVDSHRLHQLCRDSNPQGLDDLQACLDLVGVPTIKLDLSWSQVEKYQTPCITLMSSGSFAILHKSTRKRVLLEGKVGSEAKWMDKNILGSNTIVGILVPLKGNFHEFKEREFSVSIVASRLLKDRTFLIELIISSLFIQLISLAPATVSMVVIDKVIPNNGYATLDVLITGFILLTVFSVLVSVLRGKVIEHTMNKLDLGLVLGMMHQMFQLPLSYFQDRAVGDTTKKVHELRTIRRIVTNLASSTLVDFVMVNVFFIFIYIFSSNLFFVVAISIVLHLLSSITLPVTRRLYRNQYDRGRDSEISLIEATSGIETVKSLGAESSVYQRIEHRAVAFANSIRQKNQFMIVVDQYHELVANMTIAVLLWFGAHGVMAGDLTLGQLLAIYVLHFRLIGPVQRLVAIWHEFQQLRVGVERIRDVFTTPPESSLSHTSVVLHKLDGDITFENTSFYYRGSGADLQTNVLIDLSLTIPAGQVVAIVGPSGSGKSTLLKMVQCLYLPTSGKILFDNWNAALLSPQWLRQSFAVVPQETVLFDLSVQENIAIGMPEMPFDRIVEFSKLAGAHEFIINLPKAYDTKLGERGVTLSGGQRQRIAIARAIARKTSILLMDEPTSALDVESQNLLRSNWLEIVQQRTTIIVTHELASLGAVDRVISLSEGRVVEDTLVDGARA